MLAEDPSSYTATYIMGWVYYYGDGSIPGPTTPSISVWNWRDLGTHSAQQRPFGLHRMLFLQEILSTNQMETTEEGLRLIDDYTSRHYTGMEAYKGLASSQARSRR